MPDPSSSSSPYSGWTPIRDAAQTGVSAAIGERERTFAPPPQIRGPSDAAPSGDLEGAGARPANIFEDAFEHLAHSVAQAFAHGALGNEPASSTGSASLAPIAEEASRAWLTLAQRGISANLAALSELSRCQSAPDFTAWHTWVVREQLQLASEAGEAVVAIATRAIEQARRAL